MPGISAVSPPISAQPASPAAVAMPATTCGADLGLELAAGEIVEEEQRLGALHDEVVDAHRDEIDADRVVASGLDGELDLGADAVGGGDQHRVGEAGALEVEQPAEAADLGVGAGPRGRAHQRLDQLDHAVAGIDVDAGVRVGEARPVLPSANSPGRAGRTARRNCDVRNGPIAAIASAESLA